MLIFRQTQSLPYSRISVLLLRWDNDTAVVKDLSALEQVFRERYNYRTEQWDIPAHRNASLKLGVRLSSYLETAAPDHLMIVYYTGNTTVGPDGQLSWTR
jgi:hypothetical protein